MPCGGGHIPCQRPAFAANDARCSNEAAPPAVADHIGDEEGKATNTEPGETVFEPEIGTNHTKGEIDGVSATPPGSGPPATRMETATALGAQPEMLRPFGKARTLRAPQTVHR